MKSKVILFIIGLLVLSCNKEKPIKNDKSFANECSPKNYFDIVLNNKKEFEKEYTGKLTCEEMCDTGLNFNKYWLRCSYINKEFYKSSLACTYEGCYWIDN